MYKQIQPLLKKFIVFAKDRMNFKEPPRLFLKSDSKKLKKQNDFMGQRCFYFTGKYKPEIRNNFVVVIKNKKVNMFFIVLIFN